MLSWFNNALFTSLLWGSMGLCEVRLGNESKEGGVFIKTIMYGITSIIMLLFFKKEIVHDLKNIYKTDKYTLLFILLIMFIGASFAQWTYFKAFYISKNKAHIIITIVHSLPILLAVFGSSYLFNEPLNIFSYIGALLVILGIYCMKQLGPKSD